MLVIWKTLGGWALGRLYLDTEREGRLVGVYLTRKDARRARAEMCEWVSMMRRHRAASLADPVRRAAEVAIERAFERGLSAAMKARWADAALPALSPK